MLNYEAEAKKLDCPFMALHELFFVQSEGIPADPTLFCRCRASDCAMWRQESMDRPTGRGYCGLAGRPE